MTKHLQNTPKRWLWRFIWVWAMMAMVSLWALLAAASYITGRHEAREITDGHLQSTAKLFLYRLEIDRVQVLGAPHLAPVPPTRLADYTPAMHIIVWRNQTAIADTGGLAGPWVHHLHSGYQTLEIPLDGDLRRWRLYATETVQKNGQSYRVTTLVDADSHQGLALDIAEHTLRPALLLIPVLALLLVWAIRRGLEPVRQLSAAIGQLDVRRAEQRLADQPYRELDSAVEAINQLLERQQTLWLRERQFTSDVAHELRTPLTALVWRSRAVQTVERKADRIEALAGLEKEALRAAGVLQQLLDFARAERHHYDPASHVDLVVLARDAITQFVPMADEQARDLALQAPISNLSVPGHPELLAVAIRNLIENALLHTPAGTPIQVRVEHSQDGTVSLAVCDRGATDRTHISSTGLGLGLGLVQRVADAHGAEFLRAEQDVAGWNCFVLRWQPIASS